MDAHFTVNGVDLRILHFKHASLAIEYNNLWIYCDPCASFEVPTDFTKYPQADIILITHEHFDHYDPEALGILSNEKTTLIVNHVVSELLANDKIPHGKVVALKNNEKFQFSDKINFTAVPAHNLGNSPFHPKGRDNGYIVNIDGFSIYIAGDTEVVPEKIDHLDVAFLPCNRPYTMTCERFKETALALHPENLWPYHTSGTDMTKVLKELSKELTIINKSIPK